MYFFHWCCTCEVRPRVMVVMFKMSCFNTSAAQQDKYILFSSKQILWKLFALYCENWSSDAWSSQHTIDILLIESISGSQAITSINIACDLCGCNSLMWYWKHCQAIGTGGSQEVVKSRYSIDSRARTEDKSGRCWWLQVCTALYSVVSIVQTPRNTPCRLLELRNSA